MGRRETAALHPRRQVVTASVITITSNWVGLERRDRVAPPSRRVVAGRPAPRMPEQDTVVPAARLLFGSAWARVFSPDHRRPSFSLNQHEGGTSCMLPLRNLPLPIAT